MRSCPPLLLLVSPLFLALVGGFATVSASEPERAETPPSKAVEGRSCIPLVQIHETRVIDDQTIDFHMRGGTVLRNRLPNRCPQLGFEKAFSYSTSLTQLCSTDIITVIRTGGGPTRGASCGLGDFRPYTPPAEAK